MRTLSLTEATACSGGGTAGDFANCETAAWSILVKRPDGISIANCVQALGTIFDSIGTALQWLAEQRADPTKNGDIDRARNDFQNEGGCGYIDACGRKYNEDGTYYDDDDDND